MLALSGGGSRAAALGLSILDQLAALSYSDGSHQVPLIDRVKVVSAVSGGSVTAAWFGLVGPKHMDELRNKFLSKDNMSTLVWTAADPITWARLIFGGYARVDALRDLLDARLFHGQTFAALDRPNAPLVMLNATDMGSGEVFAFTPQRFDDICSNLDVLPISVGVAASAAFPVALSPLTLKSYAGRTCKGAIPAAPWIHADLSLVGPRYLNLEEFKLARYANALRHGPNAYRRIDYLHLLDGGLADNQGIHSLYDAIFSLHGPIKILNAINTGRVKRIVVIAVNARSDPDNHLSEDPATPGLLSVINAVTGIPIDQTTAYANASLQLLVDTLNQAGADAKRAAGNPRFGGLKVYGIPIDFDQFTKNETALRDRVKSIGTSWTLSSKDLSDTMKAGKMLLDQHPCFQRLLLDLGIHAGFVNASYAHNYCKLSP